MSATRIRVPLMHGRPPQIAGSELMRVRRSLVFMAHGLSACRTLHTDRFAHSGRLREHLVHVYIAGKARISR